ncbi:MAG: polyphosphate:AMP phosphotransferase, partial [Chloroflexi bacterium]|nr:polyphosphate:AMP phosphotransferase [Chloroflexota bacterium]
MFASAELGHKVEKAEYQRQAALLREELLEAQYSLREAPDFPVIILIGGVDGGGKGETVNLLNEWMDPRHIETHAMGAPTDEEQERPPMWRFWRALPPKGKIGIFFGSWYSQPIEGSAYGQTRDGDFDRSMQEIVHFERMLAAEGALILKFWFHLSKKQQRRRLETLEADPKTRWRVNETDWKHAKLYDAFRGAAERALRQTSVGWAPWTVIEGADPAYRSLTTGRAILGALNRRLAEGAPLVEPAAPPPDEAPVDHLLILQTLDQTQQIDAKAYDGELERRQGRLNLVSRRPAFQKRSVVAVFEGPDAAGKGGAIRRVSHALDARQYEIIPTAAPTEEERAQPYLWRFWRRLPRRGQFAMFDRSWYGRVLVERVEGLCPPADWRRAYAEINDFEAQMRRHGVILVKFWLSITKDEQLRHFEERRQTGFKHYKITDEDWRNREKWEQYEQAASDMVDRTSTEAAPWV